MVVDNEGKLIVANNVTRLIEKLDPETGTVTTVVTPKTLRISKDPADPLFYKPSGVAVERDGKIIIVDQGNARILRFDPTTSEISALAGGESIGFKDGVGKAAQFRQPSGVVIDAAGTILIADSGNHRIRALNPITRAVTTLAGRNAGFADGIGDQASFDEPDGLTVALDGSIVICDAGRIRKLDTISGQVTTLAGTGSFGYIDGRTIGEAEFALPHSVVSSPFGGIFVAGSVGPLRFIAPDDPLERELIQFADSGTVPAELKDRLVRETLTGDVLPETLHSIRTTPERTANYLGLLPKDLHNELIHFTLGNRMKRLRLAMAIVKTPNHHDSMALLM